MSRNYIYEGIVGTYGTKRVSIEFRDSNNDVVSKFYCSSILNDAGLNVALVAGMGTAVYNIAQQYGIPVSMPTDIGSLNTAVNTVIAALASQSQSSADALAYCLLNYFAAYDIPYFNNLLLYDDVLNGGRSSLFFKGAVLVPPYIFDSNMNLVSLPSACPNVASVYIEFGNEALA